MCNRHDPRRDRAATIRARARLASLAITAVFAARATAGAVAPSPDVVTQRLSLTRVSLQRLRTAAARTEVIPLDLDGRPRHRAARPRVASRPRLPRTGRRARRHAPRHRSAGAGDVPRHRRRGPGLGRGRRDPRGTRLAHRGARGRAGVRGPALSPTSIARPIPRSTPSIPPTPPPVRARARADEPAVAVPPRGPAPEAALRRRAPNRRAGDRHRLRALPARRIRDRHGERRRERDERRQCRLQARLQPHPPAGHDLIVRSAPSDPYSTTSSDSLLTQMRTHWNAAQTGVHRDIAHLMTGKNLDGSVIGIASVGVICNSTRGYGLSQTRYTTHPEPARGAHRARAGAQLERRALRRRDAVPHHVLEHRRVRRHRSAELRAAGDRRDHELRVHPELSRHAPRSRSSTPRPRARSG